MFHVKQYDVVVIGAGHAGTEAAFVAARMGAKVALVTFSHRDLGVMSCNPAIGGLGKGHLVREIDAMDGLMGRAADFAGIQFRLLNRKKGPAVQGPRVQADRKRYAHFITQAVSAAHNLDVVEAEVTGLLFDQHKANGIELKGGAQILARAVVLTTGTFLGGRIHIGDESFSAGRVGDHASNVLAAQIADIGLDLGRLKTGTPPRLDAKTIDWAYLGAQQGDADPVFMSFLSSAVSARQVACGVTHTNAQTHDIIHQNLKKSAIYGGMIKSSGPRYCPSVEDKVVRFADKSSHQIFLEPEGLDTNLVYPNGISTSLPADVQESFVRTIEGLGKVKIVQPGYAIEYDFVDPRALTASLECKAMHGLFLAGQINGTTGYEEAAAQGLLAGINGALLALERPALTLSRAESYIGVMVDDLILRGVSEPYRMFTSRAEYRLALRADNADQRLTPLGVNLGCVGDSRREAFENKLLKLSSARTMMDSIKFGASEVTAIGIPNPRDGAKRTARELLSIDGVSFDDVAVLLPALADVDVATRRQLEREAIYTSYLARQQSQIDVLKRDEAVELPADLNYAAIAGLSGELSSKLSRIRPRSLSQAGRLEGMTPAALVLVLSAVRREQKVASR